MSASKMLQDARTSLVVQGPGKLLQNDVYVKEDTGQFCAVGALLRIANYRGEEFVMNQYLVAATALRVAAEELYGFAAEEVNDQYGYEAVLKVYDRAIKEFEAA